MGGQKFVCQKGTVPQIKVQHTKKHFTLMGFTALNGEPVLFLIILSGVRENLNIETGIDNTKDTIGDATDKDFFEKILVPVNCFLVDPPVHFEGKTYRVW